MFCDPTVLMKSIRFSKGRVKAANMIIGYLLPPAFGCIFLLDSFSRLAHSCILSQKFCLKERVGLGQTVRDMRTATDRARVYLVQCPVSIGTGQSMTTG